MAFWGIELKPGEPYTYVHDTSPGALRVSQATLGNGTATERSVVQCNVGDKSPVLLCSLLPDRVESCCLDLQFEEDDDVVFSVVGPRSVHLTGYFLGDSSGGGDADDSDSYCEDIWEMGSEDSDSYSSEDEDASDFVDDGDIKMSTFTQCNSGVLIEEIIEDEKPTNGQHLEQKHQVNDSDGEDDPQQVKHNELLTLESEDEDGFPISHPLSDKDIGKDVDDSKILDTDRKRKLDAILLKGSERKDKVDAVNNEKSKKKKKGKGKSVKSPETGISEQIGEGPTVDQNKDADDKKDEALPCQGECQNVDQEDEMSAIENSGKLKKKKKEWVKKEETSEARGNLLVDKLGQGASTDNTAVSNVELVNAENGDDELMVKSGQASASGKKDTIGFSVSSATSVGTDKSKRKKKGTKDRNPLDNENKSSRIVGENGSDKSQTQVNKNKLSSSQEKMDEDQLASELSHNTNANSGAGSTVGDAPDKAKKKQKNKKLQNSDSAVDKELDIRNEAPRKPRTFANGLVIEELSMGQPDGKRASLGKTVFVRYIGKLRSGKIFDSNVGQKPFKFRLGVGQVIKGWDVGVDGMRIGDKRRLTIPPSMGYGEKGAGGVIPGNAWLIFDLELVDVK